MAKFIPSITPEDFNNSYGEKKVYEALQTLDDSYTVFYSLSWIGINEQRTLGEADFVIVNPEKGILVIEVKSGDIKYTDGEWIQTNTLTGYSKKIDPYNQARKSQFELIDRLNSSSLSFRVPFVCYAVWFPTVNISEKTVLPLEADKAITLDETSLNQPSSAVEGAYDFWLTKKENINRKVPLDRSKNSELISALCPHFHIIPSLKSKIEEMDRTYLQLTNQQIHLLDYLEEQKTAVIHGAAGTGKTVLAVEKAKRLAEHGENVLFLCYNAFLRDFLKDSNTQGNIIFHNAHSLAYEIMGNGAASADDVLKEFEDFLEIVFDEESWGYDNIIVDEGQDLDDRLLNRLYELVRKKKGCFYVFYDRNQHITNNNPPEWIEQSECRLILNKNCRNSAEIFKTSCSLLGLDSIKYNDIHGDIPSLSLYSSEEEMNRTLATQLKKLIDEGIDKSDIAILSASTVEKSWFNPNNIATLTEVSDKKENGKVLFTTIRKFKGLEANVVFIIDVMMTDLLNQGYKRLLYTGTSRAKNLLYILMQEDVDSNSYERYYKQLAPERHVPNNLKGLKRILNVNIFQ